MLLQIHYNPFSSANPKSYLSKKIHELIIEHEAKCTPDIVTIQRQFENEEIQVAKTMVEEEELYCDVFLFILHSSMDSSMPPLSFLLIIQPMLLFLLHSPKIHSHIPSFIHSIHLQIPFHPSTTVDSTIIHDRPSQTYPHISDLVNRPSHQAR